MGADSKIRKTHEELLSRMLPGQSFFVEAAPSDLTYVRKLGYKLGIKLSIRSVTVDEIYGVPGSRVIRKE